MGRSLSGWGKLNHAPGGWRRLREPAALLRGETLHADEWLEVLRGDLLIEAGYSLDVESQRVLFLGLFQCAVFWSPLDYKFLDGCEPPVMFDSAGFGAGQNAKNGRVTAGGVIFAKGFRDSWKFSFGKLCACVSFLSSFVEVKGYAGDFPRWLRGRRRDILKGFRYGGLP